MDHITLSWQSGAGNRSNGSVDTPYFRPHMLLEWFLRFKPSPSKSKTESQVQVIQEVQSSESEPATGIWAALSPPLYDASDDHKQPRDFC